MQYMRILIILLTTAFYCVQSNALGFCTQHLEKNTYTFTELQQEKWFQVLLARNDHHLIKDKKVDQNFINEYINAVTVMNITPYTAQRMLSVPKNRLDLDRIFELYEFQKPAVRGFIHYRLTQKLGFSKKEVIFLKEIYDLQALISKSYLAIDDNGASKDTRLKQRILMDIVFYKDLIHTFADLKLF